MSVRMLIFLVLALCVTGASFGASLLRRRREDGVAVVKYDTMSGPVHIYTIEHDDDYPTRVMDVDGAMQSATYIDDERCYDLVFGYHKAYDCVFAAGVRVSRMLMLGGGGYAYPEHVVSEYPDAVVDVVEMDPVMTALAQRYFFLDRLMVEFDTERTGRLNIVEDEGRRYLESCDVLYDAIVNDCFSGREPATGLATLEAAQVIHSRLRPGGVYLSNVIGSLHGERSEFLHGCMHTLGQVFAHVYVVPGKPAAPCSPDNNVVIATDGAYEFDGAVQVEGMEHACVLRDATVRERDWTVPFA